MTGKAELRRVKFKPYDHITEWRQGYFHRWSDTTYSTDNGTFQETQAIIEDEYGKVQNVNIHLIQFIN